MFKRALGLAAITGVFVVSSIGIALATPPTPEEVIADTADSLSDSILSLVVTLAPILAGVVAVFIGLNLVLRKMRGVAK